MADRFYARSASDHAEDWPWWFVADRNLGGINRTAEIADLLGVRRRPGQTLTTRACAATLAQAAMEAIHG